MIIDFENLGNVPIQSATQFYVCFSSRRYPHIHIETDSSNGLAEMTKSDYPTIQFIHESLRDFPIKDNGLRELFPELEQDFEGSCHSRLKQCCQTYMQVNISAYVHFTDTLPTASSKEAKDPRQNYILAENNLSSLLSATLKFDPTTDVEGEQYFPPLLAAVVNGNEDSAKLLVEKGANIEVKDKQERTALYLAAETGHLGIVQILLEGKADVNAQGGYYGNVLQAASVKGYDKIVAPLLDKGADANAQGEHYGNALQAVSIKAHDKIAALPFEKGPPSLIRKIVTLFLDRHPDENAQGGFYGNALQAASIKGHDKIAALLLKRGADVNAQGGYYGIALQAVSVGAHDKIAALLRKNGAI
ncbi:hypothetical protein DL764_002870 [Monosporascus ibericus]|uniref:Uncharacterized protein n=1 Tax=Monosporascus ibericus TaxID=155417 RepID=A0A4Q4TKK8_9PEZI|nr:hypothetical protein DL764_002870 [Monosporascus ibericus]